MSIYLVRASQANVTDNQQEAINVYTLCRQKHTPNQSRWIISTMVKELCNEDMYYWFSGELFSTSRDSRSPNVTHTNASLWSDFTCQIPPGGLAQAGGMCLACQEQGRGLKLWEAPQPPETMAACLLSVRSRGEDPNKRRQEEYNRDQNITEKERKNTWMTIYMFHSCSFKYAVYSVF